MTEPQSLSLYTGAILVGALAGGALPLFARDAPLRPAALLLRRRDARRRLLPHAARGGRGGRRGGASRSCSSASSSSTCSSASCSCTSAPSPARTRGSRPRARRCRTTPASTRTAPRPRRPRRHRLRRAHARARRLRRDERSTRSWTASRSARRRVEPELGLLVFLAILAHKIPNAFSLSAILLAEGYSRGQGGRDERGVRAHGAASAPALYVLLREMVHVERFTSLALAASAGTFLHLSLSDILPDLHRRGALALAALGGDGGGARPHGRAHPAAPRALSVRARRAAGDRVVAPAGRG